MIPMRLELIENKVEKNPFPYERCSRQTSLLLIAKRRLPTRRRFQARSDWLTLTACFLTCWGRREIRQKAVCFLPHGVLLGYF
jgi:hypothetical protein